MSSSTTIDKDRIYLSDDEIFEYSSECINELDITQDQMRLFMNSFISLIICKNVIKEITAKSLFTDLLTQTPPSSSEPTTPPPNTSTSIGYDDEGWVSLSLHQDDNMKTK